MASLAVERDRPGAVRWPGLEVLLDFETRRALLLDDRHRAVALSAESLHRGGVEHCAIGTAGEREPCENLPIFGTQDDKCLGRRGIGIRRRRWPCRCRLAR